MSPIAFPDAKWLEFLKAGGLAFFGIALASGAFLYLEHVALVPALPAWAQDILVLVFLLTTCLTVSTVLGAIWNFFEPHVMFATAVDNHRRRRFIRQRIAYMTPEERHIICYILAHNQTVFTATRDGGRATTLIASRILEMTGADGQVATYHKVPFAVPEIVWTELVKQRDKFPLR
jgi:hypothetical protein